MFAWAEIAGNGRAAAERHGPARAVSDRWHAGMRALMAACTLMLPLLAAAPAAHAEEPAAVGIGRPATPAEIMARDIDVRGPDGAGLPEGRGTVAEGEAVYAERCAACHGEFGEGQGRMPALIGGEGTLATDRPRRTIGSFWPWAPTLFDYIRRAMPFGEAHVLTINEIYALTAFLLEVNGIVEADFVATPESLPKVRMPNRNGFIADTRRVITGPRCFRDCLTRPPEIIAVAPDAAAATTQGEGE